MSVFLGVDWAEDHHDLHLMDEAGRPLAAHRVPEGVDGLAQTHALIAEHTDDPAEVIIGIETDRGLFVAGLIAAGYQVYAINPLAVSRYRDRHTISGAKSDKGDSKLLADLVRTDRHNHRLVAADSQLLEAVKVLARAHKNLVWTRQRQTNQLRSALREFYPAALAAFDALDHPDALAVLAKAPTPTQGRALSTAQIAAALRRGGRKRNIDKRAAQIRDALRAPALAAPPLLEDAFGATVAALAPLIGELNAQIAQVEAKLVERFRQHPDAELILSLPGLGDVLGARALAEFGDAPNRYADAKARRNYAGAAPVTRQSGTTKAVSARHIRNKWLFDTCWQWAFCALSASPGARAYYDAHNPGPHTSKTARRKLANKLVGILHGVLEHRTPYDEDLAWSHWNTQTDIAA